MHCCVLPCSCHRPSSVSTMRALGAVMASSAHGMQQLVRISLLVIHTCSSLPVDWHGLSKGILLALLDLATAT